MFLLISRNINLDELISSNMYIRRYTIPYFSMLYFLSMACCVCSVINIILTEHTYSFNSMRGQFIFLHASYYIFTDRISRYRRANCRTGSEPNINIKYMNYGPIIKPDIRAWILNYVIGIFAVICKFLVFSQ